MYNNFITEKRGQGLIERNPLYSLVKLWEILRPPWTVYISGHQYIQSISIHRAR